MSEEIDVEKLKKLLDSMCVLMYQNQTYKIIGPWFGAEHKSLKEVIELAWKKQ